MIIRFGTGSKYLNLRKNEKSLFHQFKIYLILCQTLISGTGSFYPKMMDFCNPLKPVPTHAIKRIMKESSKLLSHFKAKLITHNSLQKGINLWPFVQSCWGLIIGSIIMKHTLANHWHAMNLDVNAAFLKKKLTRKCSYSTQNTSKVLKGR